MYVFFQHQELGSAAKDFNELSIESSMQINSGRIEVDRQKGTARVNTP